MSLEAGRSEEILAEERQGGGTVKTEDQGTAGLYKAETAMLRQAVAGDESAAQEVLQYLGSANPDLRHLMQRVLHEHGDEQLWFQLLKCMASPRTL